VITQAEADANPGWIALLGQLAQSGRACRLQAGGPPVWLARERLGQLSAVFPGAHLEPALPVLPGFDQPYAQDIALSELLRARLSGFGP
jgi:ATP-dependent Lhr-like helicase